MEESNQPAAAPPQPAPNAVASLPPMKDSWPGAFGLYKYSKQAIKLNLQPYVLLIVLNAVISLVLRAVLKEVGSFVSFILDSLLGAAVTLVLLASVQNRRISLNKAFSEAVPLWLNFLGLQLLVVLSLFVSILLFIVPFFFVLPRLVLASYFLVDKKMGVLEAYKASWHASKGHGGKVLGIIGVNIAFVLLILTIIGIPFAIYFLFMYQAAFALLYMFVSSHQAQPSVAVATPPVEAAPTNPVG